VLELLAAGIKAGGMAHITGGGLPGNLPRCFARGIGAVIDTASWRRPEIFDWLQAEGDVDEDEMRRVFNCGIGYVIVVPRLQADAALALLKKARARPWLLGEIVAGKQDLRYA
jgi:phosphoribosylformylglycinamidine cyclo-ligase